MLLASRLVDAQRAHAVGAVMSVVEDLDAEVATLLDGIGRASGVTLRTTKSQLVQRSQTLEVAPADDDDVLREVYTGADFSEGVRAFRSEEHTTELQSLMR